MRCTISCYTKIDGRNRFIVIVRRFVANVKDKGRWSKTKGQGSVEDETKSLKNITCHPYEESLHKEFG